MIRKCFSLLGGVVLLAAVAGEARATIYTSDANIADLTAGISNYATFSNYLGGDVTPTFTPDSNELANQGYRVYAGILAGNGLDPTNNWILAAFSSPVAAIRVFPNIDHFGDEYDGYQYQIAGSNDGTNWTPLFDVLTTSGFGEPFTLGTTTGTAPTVVNNVLTPGDGPGGTVGYEADFSFGQAYQYYAFGASTDANNSGNADQELSGIGALPSAVPEPGSCVLAVSALATLLGFKGRRFAVAAAQSWRTSGR